MNGANDDHPGSYIDTYEPEDWGSPYGAPILDVTIEAAFLNWLKQATPPTLRAAFNAAYIAGSKDHHLSPSINP